MVAWVLISLLQLMEDLGCSGVDTIPSIDGGWNRGCSGVDLLPPTDENTLSPHNSRWILHNRQVPPLVFVKNTLSQWNFRQRILSFSDMTYHQHSWVSVSHTWSWVWTHLRSCFTHLASSLDHSWPSVWHTWSWVLPGKGVNTLFLKECAHHLLCRVGQRSSDVL